MSSSPDLAPHSYVLRGRDTGRARPARLAENLMRSPFTAPGVADPRLVDPHLEAVVEQAALDARARGFKAGYAAGLDQGREQGREEMARERRELADLADAERSRLAARLGAVVDAADAAVAQALDRRIPLLEQMRDLIVTASVDLAEALIGHHLAVGGCGARDAVARALREVPQQADVVVRLNPSDLGEIRGDDAVLGEHNVVRLLADADVEPGGAVAVAGNLEVDAQLSNALARVHRVLQP